MRTVGPPGRSVSEVFAALLRRAGEVPAWPQFPAGRTLPTHQGRIAVAAACSALGVGPADEVLIPAWNCGTEVDALLASGAHVVPYRVDLRGRIDVDDLRRRMTPRTRAVYVIHYFGWPQELADLRALCRDHGLLLVEDCALALFSADGAAPIGRDADASIFSFRKSLAVPEGGALVTRAPAATGGVALDRPSTARVVRATLGLVKRRLAGRGAWPSAFARRRAPAPPTRLRSRPAARAPMPSSYRWDPRAAEWTISGMTLGLLRAVDPAAAVARRRAHYARLLEAIDGLPGVRPLFAELPPGVCPLELPILVDDRDGWVAALAARGVHAYPWWAGYHPRVDWESFPDACDLKDHVVALPVHHDLDDDALARVAAATVATARSACP